jgi:predicted ArsR family transcriptional regulator
MDHTDPDPRLDQQLDGVSGLADPVRRALYRYVAARDGGTGRDDAAEAVGIGRSLAAYHLDKLVDDGLLVPRFERRSGRSGPGAGRPAKLYERSGRQIELSLPSRDYAALAGLLAQAVEADPSGVAEAGLRRAARELGARLGDEGAGGGTGGGDAPGDALAEVRRVLAGRGYEPYEEPPGVVRLRNCPFDRLAADHRRLVCNANLALIGGLTERLGLSDEVEVGLDPLPGQCCVALTAAR